MEIREARVGDAQRVLELLEEFATSYKPDPSAFVRHFPQLVRSHTAPFLVAEQSGRVIGYLLAFELLTLYANGVVVDVQELVVDPAARGRGIGRALVQALVERARREGSREITVPTRRAADFYEKLGFERTADYFKLAL